jgi:hypothetical protein
VHLDNGWNSELAVDNIKRTLTALDIPLYTCVIDWEEFRDLILSFMRASVANCEIPTDHAITAILFHVARREGLRYILSGSNLVTEAIIPIAWSYHSQDLRHLKALHKRFGKVPLETMPTLSLRRLMFDVVFKGVRQVPLLNYINYNKREWQESLAISLGWRDYGGKHYESIWTRFFQGYYLPTKFGYDKRRAHLSTLICSSQISRKDALEELKRPSYDPELLRQDMTFVLKKLALTSAEFEEIIKAPPKEVTDYPSCYNLLQGMRKYKDVFKGIATKI